MNLMKLVLVAAVCVLCGCERQQGGTNPAQSAAEQRVRSIVTLGMSGVEVVDSLDRAGIRHSGIVQPVRNSNYFQIHVPIRDSIGGGESLEYAITGSTRATGGKAYIIIELDGTGIVTKIE